MENGSKHKIAVIPGDEIGPATVPAGTEVLNASAGRFWRLAEDGPDDRFYYHKLSNHLGRRCLESLT